MATGVAAASFSLPVELPPRTLPAGDEKTYREQPSRGQRMKWLAVIPLALAGCTKKPPVPLSHEAYVWQDAARPAVAAAMKRADGGLSGFVIRAAEMRWSEGKFAVQRFAPQRSLPGNGVVVRIGSSASQLEWTPEQVAPVAEIFRELSKLQPREIQCDYDCPQKRLARYQVLLDALQSAAGNVPVVPTTLPSWLDEPAFRKLIAARQDYVLQVHSLQLPARPDAPPVVFDPAAARQAVRKAAALGTPFRVAMATYGCEVRFDAAGKITDVISEDISAPAAAGVRRGFALADPAASAELVREWTARRPANMRGIVWYRLPVQGDRRNWPGETLRLVMRGETDATKPELKAIAHNGPSDLFVGNPGHFPIRLPAEIIVTTPAVAADGGGAYRLETRGDGLHFLLRDDVWPWLDPGQKISSGWLRTEGNPARIAWLFLP